MYIIIGIIIIAILVLLGIAALLSWIIETFGLLR